MVITGSIRPRVAFGRPGPQTFETECEGLDIIRLEATPVIAITEAGLPECFTGPINSRS